MEREISQAVIRRLPRYYRYLGELLEEGVDRISSGELSKRMHVTASQIRQDLNKFGGFGQQGYGYNVEFLHEEIGRILGLTERHNMIVIGVGNLGQAITNYMRFDKLGFSIIGLFDSNPAMQGEEIRGIPIRLVEELPEFLSEHQVDIAALTLPKDAATPIAYTLSELGVNAIWNFAHVDLDEVPGVVVENVHLSDSLMQLSYSIANDKDRR